LIRQAAALAIALLSTLVHAQDVAGEQRYCAALLDRYLRYAGVTEYPGTPGKLSNDNQAALAQARCQSGDTAAGIAILERKLRDAKLDPPPRP
jgi:hypothetical protein